MMKPGHTPNEHYTIAWEADHRLLALRIGGFWTEAVIKAFGADVLQAIRQAGGRPFDMAADLSAAGPQLQIVVLLAGGVIDQFVAAGLARFVIIGATALLRMQVKRAAAPLVPIFVADWAEARDRLAQAA